ncbi:helicase-related protein [Bacillus sp. 1P06AnD]|uniref:helicase-related protein n=1 Tax=Bacillus sp. 1P06AnD TaxID=3132208 RepID=UPI0039A0BD52
MKKLRVMEDGKQFEVFIKFILSERVDHTQEPVIVGIGYAGSFTAARAVHAALYDSHVLHVVDEKTDKVEMYRSSKSFRRIETVDGKVTHHTLLPRSTSDDDYQQSLNEMVRTGSKHVPERVVIAPKGNIMEVAGQYIAEAFGLPKSKDWANQYLTILGIESCMKIEVATTDLAGDWKEIKAVKVVSMTEESVLAKMETAIKNKVLNPRSTSIMGQGVFTKDMTTTEYLKANAELLGKKLDAFMKPLTDGTVLSPFMGELNRIPLPAQAKVSMAALEVLKRKKGVFITAEMGTGKTQISLTSVFVYMKQREKTGAKDGIRVLVIAPSNVLPKWATSEIPKVIKKQLFTTRIISNTNEALEYVRQVKQNPRVPKGLIEFVLVSTDRMKLAAQGYVLGSKWDSKNHVWRSPDTGKALLKHTKKKGESAEDAVAGWVDVIEKPKLPPTPADIIKSRKAGTLLPNGLPKDYVIKWKPDIRNLQEDYDGKTNRSLARPARKEWGETHGGARWMIADIFQKHLRNHFHMAIYDEIHQMKASDSGRGLALAKMLQSCRKSFFLTGTLTNGSSSSIQALIWRAFAGEMLKEGITYSTSKEQWAQRYGVLEKIVTQHDGDKNVGVHTNRKKETVIVKERPGISPKLLANYLFDKSTFLDLADLQVPMVEFNEIPVVVDLDDDHLEEYKKLHSDLYTNAIHYQREMGTAAWSHFNPVTINYADQPQKGAEVQYVARDGVLLDTVVAKAFPKSYRTAKERALLKHVEKEVRDKRRCIIFTNYTGGYKTNERLKSILEEQGIACEIMNDKVKVADRFEWLDYQAKTGKEVLIMNMRLIEVGLDLMEFPTLMFYQLNDDINVVRQASKRSHRLGQHRACKVMFFVANNTNQLTQFQRLMSRRIAAMIVEGRIERSDELAKYADTSTNTLVSDLSKTLSAVELTNAWKSAAVKDLDQDLQLVSEAEFKERVNQSFKELTDETLRICGYQPSQEADFNWDAFEAALNEFDKVEEAYQALEMKLAKQQEEQVKQKQQDELEKRRQKRRKEFDSEVIHGVEQLDFLSLLS